MAHTNLNLNKLGSKCPNCSSNLFHNVVSDCIFCRTCGLTVKNGPLGKLVDSVMSKSKAKQEAGE